MTARDYPTTTQPLVSVIVPTYNYGLLIGETLGSLQRQTLADWECVVVDDGSTDDTAEVVARVAEHDARSLCVAGQPTPVGLRRTPALCFR